MKNIRFYFLCMLMVISSFAFAGDLKEINKPSNHSLLELHNFADYALYDYWSHRGDVRVFKWESDRVSRDVLLKEVVKIAGRNGKEIASMDEIATLSLESAIKLIDILGSDPGSCEKKEDVFKWSCATRALLIALVNELFRKKGTLKLAVYSGWLDAHHAEETFIAIFDLDHKELLFIDSIYDS